MEPFSAWFHLGGLRRKSSNRPPASAEREPDLPAHMDITPRLDLQLCPFRTPPTDGPGTIRFHRTHFRSHLFSLWIRVGARLG